MLRQCRGRLRRRGLTRRQARALADLQLLVQQVLSNWQSQLRDEQMAQDQLASEEKRLQEELTLSIIRAPAAGTVQGLIGLSTGTYIIAGQSLGAVSPDDKLLVETLVSPKDIGLIRVGQPVRLQIPGRELDVVRKRATLP